MEMPGLEDAPRREPEQPAEKVYTWEIREGLAQDLTLGNWIMECDHVRRIKAVRSSLTGVHNTTSRVYFVLDDGTECVYPGRKEITIAIRTRVK